MSGEVEILHDNEVILRAPFQSGVIGDRIRAANVYAQTVAKALERKRGVHKRCVTRSMTARQDAVGVVHDPMDCDACPLTPRPSLLPLPPTP